MQEIILATGATRGNAKHTFDYLDEVETKIKTGLIKQIDEIKEKLKEAPEGLISENLPEDIKELEELRARLEDLLKKQEEPAQKPKVDTSGLIEQINEIKEKLKEVPEGLIPENLGERSEEELKELHARLEDLLKKQEQETKDAWLAIGAAGLSAAVEIGNTLMQQAQSNLAEWTAKIDAALDDELVRIEKMRQKALEAAGFAEVQRAEDMEAEIEAARQSGDKVLEYELKRRQEEMRINEDFDAQAKAAREKAENEKNQLEYESEKITYAQQLISAGNAIAQAILNAWATTTPTWLAPVTSGLAVAAGAVQMGVLLANPPKAPAPVHLADGGFVPGPRAAGDTIPIMATAGELVLNKAQQENVAEAIDGTTQAFIYLQFESEILGMAVAEWANQKGGVFHARAVRK